MKHITAILIKYVMVAIILEIVFMFMASLSFWKILLIAAAVTVIAYFICDVLILSKTNNITATICDAVLSFIIIYAFYFTSTFGSITFLNAIVSAIIIAIGDWFFHKYMVKSILVDPKRSNV